MENQNLNKTDISQPNKKDDFSSAELAKKPLWFLFLAANVMIVIGCVITFALAYRGEFKANLLWIPTLVCNLLAIALAAIFLVFEVRDIGPKVMHYQKKWLKFYLVAFVFLVLAILFNAIYFLIGSKEFLGKYKVVHLSLYLAFTVVFSLLSIGFQRFARFKIDLDIYRRKHGINPNEQTQKKDEVKSKPIESKIDSKPTDVKPSATGSLLDQMDK